MYWITPQSELKPSWTNLRSLLSVTHSRYANKRQNNCLHWNERWQAHSPHTSPLAETSQLNVINGVRHCSQDWDTMNNPAGLLIFSPYLSPAPFHFLFPHTHTFFSKSVSGSVSFSAPLIPPLCHSVTIWLLGHDIYSRLTQASATVKNGQL